MSQVNGDLKIYSSEDLASRYALQIALKTLKERCAQLQSRLSAVEQENLQLKIDRQKLARDGKKSDEPEDSLRLQIERLMGCKHQLTQHIRMVTSENKQLWTRLSSLAEGNESLNTRANKGDSLTPYSSSNKPFLDEKDASMREISIKLAQLRDKSPEKRHCSESLINENIRQFLTNNEDSLSDGQEDSLEGDEDKILTILEALKSTLSGNANFLKRQNDALKKCVGVLTLTANGKLLCALCQRARKRICKDVCIMTESLADMKICPMCERSFSHMNMEDFSIHVQSHLVVMGEEEEHEMSDLE